MEATTNEILGKLKLVKEETDVIEMRVVNTRKHVEHTEKEIENMKHVVLKGFHSVNAKINQMEDDIHNLMGKIDILIKNIKVLEKTS